MFMKMRRARFFAQFILSGQSEILRCAQDDSEGLRMTAGKRFSAACTATCLPMNLSRQVTIFRHFGGRLCLIPSPQLT